ncbi:hypothetical protein QYE76_043329 [Lolium multiflorum]|uniref:RNase H type-1 domain-containing protein n=1 Tax=Lolium multiflorum TaxID=4521 RepID=A0AAD8TIX5_LOLMU|nr:hypothetical protein QYE76_043329 [Lolium multiflorum]
MGGEESGGGRKRVLVGSYRAGPLAGEDWQKRKRISFTLQDRLDRHAIAAGAFASLLFLDPSLFHLSSPDLLSDLEKNSIFCWFDLKNAFEKHFRGTYKRPATTSDLQACIQKKGETSRNFLTRWLACRNECENVDNRTAMHAFIGGLQRGGLLRHKLTCMVNANQLTLDDMITIASDHTAADDDAGGDLAATAIPLHQQKKNRDNGGSSSHKRKNPMTRRVADPRWSSWRFNAEVQEAEEDADAEAEPAGSAYLRGKSTHTNRNCKWVNDLKNDLEAGYKRARKHRPRGKGGKGKNKDKEDDSSEAMDEDDNSPDPKAGSAGKSNPFDKKPNSLGSITLPVAFGDVHNFREEKITFEVVPFKSSYHVIFGRPTYHKFHACYIYNKLKIPGPKGATYQRTMQRCLKDQIGRNVHAYVDDIAVMTRKGSDLISDLTETFDNLRRSGRFCCDWTSSGCKSEPEPETWVMHFDGSKQHQGSGAGVTLKSPTGEELQYVLQIHFEATNNMAEYEALLHGLRIAKEMGIKHVEIPTGIAGLKLVMAAYRS